MSEEKTPEKSHNTIHFNIIAVLFFIALLVGLLVIYMWIKGNMHFERARITTTKTRMLKIKEAIQMYKIYKAKYPDSLQDLVPEYIKEESKLRDGWKQEFHYAPQGDEGDFNLISGGPDGNINTTENNISIWELIEEYKESDNNKIDRTPHSGAGHP